MTARRLQENYNFCIQGYLQEKGVRFYIPYELKHRYGHFSIMNWPNTDIKILNKKEILKVMKYKTLLEFINKSYWFPIMRKIIVDTRVSQNPDEYMCDILWGESGSRIVRDEEGVEETETREKEEREKKEKEEREKREKEEREERERLNKYKNMETSEIIKRSKVLQKINQSQRRCRWKTRRRKTKNWQVY